MASLEKAIITNTVTRDFVTVQFNPEEYTVSRDNNFAQATVAGSSAPLLQFANGNMQTLEMELLIDTVEAHDGSSAGSDVREQVRKVTDLMNINPSTHAPPPLLFTWATLSFSCVLARASQRFIMFRSDGAPVRARLQVTFNEFCNAELEARAIRRETADYSKRHVVIEGETLSVIAAHVYENPAAWRPIGIVNRIDDPRRLTPGQVLLIPRLPFRDPMTGEALA
jgi:nucleoid-associated protein YgaU